ncbi:chorismate--pyruvate lyase family protein [Acinetobacter sp. c1-l78]|uniref:chorismate--pyruvate lyase family protein n=1 Tax=Acinetobacter sp. c1-l78 TaxID=3342803 RepID=UPI0035BAC958
MQAMPRYQQQSRLLQQVKTAPKPLQSWLLARGSLTKQLTQLANGQFRVQVLSNGWQKLDAVTAQRLDCRPQQLAWVRESYLFGSSRQPWVKARSIIPISSLQKQARIFRYIGKKPMGKILFFRQNPTGQRWCDKTQLGYARQSCYLWQGCQVLVEEIFLDAFQQFLNKTAE